MDTGVFRDTSDFKVTYNYDLAHSRFSPYAYYADGNEPGAGYMEKYNGLFTKANGYAYGNPVLLESKKSGSAANGARIELGTYKNTFSLIANPIQTNYVVDIGTYSTNQELNLSMPDENGVWGEPQRTVVTSYNQTIINGKSALNLFGRDNTPDNPKSTLNDLADFTEMTVVITDTVDPTNVLRIKMTEGNYDTNGKLVNGSKMTFDYNGVTGDAAGEYTTDKDWSHLMGGLANSHTPFMFEFYASHANDKYTLKMGGLRDATYNLKNRAVPYYPQGGSNGTNPGITNLTFNSRNEFSVAIEFGGITDGQTFDYYRSEMSEIKYDRKARLAVYSVNGQPLVGNPEEITEVSVSKASGAQLYSGFVGVPYSLSEYSQFSPLYGTGKYPATYTSIVLKKVDCTPAQTITLNADNTFTPTAAGIYEATYFISAGYTKHRFNVYTDTESPVITLLGEYSPSYRAGKTLNVIQAEVYDNSGKFDYGVAAAKNGSPVEITEGKIALSEGEYTITYSASDFSGNRAEDIVKSFYVYTLTLPAERTAEITGSEMPVPTAVYTSGYSLETRIYGNDNELLAENVQTYAFPIADDYTVEFTLKKNNETVAVESFVYSITDNTPPVIELSGNYDEWYACGTELNVIGYTVRDNSLVMKSESVKVYFGGAQVEVSGGIAKLKNDGEYTVKYNVEDYGGNAAAEIVKTFKVYTITAPEQKTFVKQSTPTVLPLLSATGLSVETALYAKSDETFENALEVSEGKYLFAEAGKYVIVYTLKDGTETVQRIPFEITIEDVTAPVITKPDYESSYEINSELAIKEVVAESNTTDGITYSYKVYLNGEDISARVVEGKLTLSEAGSYKIVYTAAAFDGKTGTETIEFTVSAASETEGCKGAFSGGEAVIALAAAMVAVFIKKKMSLR